MVTNTIKLGTGVTVLSSDDPVRVYERFATVDALSNGRAQIMLGRGSFTESFPLFGYDLQDYEELFEEKTAMFSELRKGKPLTWEGRVHAILKNADVFKNRGHQLDTYLGVSVEPLNRSFVPSVMGSRYVSDHRWRACSFAPYVDLYKRQRSSGQPILPIGMHSHGVIADTDEDEIGWNYIKRAWTKSVLIAAGQP